MSSSRLGAVVLVLSSRMLGRRRKWDEGGRKSRIEGYCER